jgi:hypothetical protein
MTADLELQTRLHRYGLAEWVRRNDRNEMLRVAQSCVDALDKIQAQELEIERLNKKCSALAFLQYGKPDETSAQPDWKHRAEEAERILSDNMALANKTTRRAMDERNGIIRKLRERYSAIEIADMAGLTRQRVHQILNEAPVEGSVHGSSAETPAPPDEETSGCAVQCGGCGLKAILRFTDKSKQYVNTTSIDGWTVTSEAGIRCPKCSAQKAGDEHGR